MVGWCGSQTKAKEFHDLCIRLHSIFAKLLRSTDVKIVHIFICFRSGVDEKYFQIIHKHLAGVFLILFFFVCRYSNSPEEKKRLDDEFGAAYIEYFVSR